jgi:hypothetical protein
LAFASATNCRGGQQGADLHDIGHAHDAGNRRTVAEEIVGQILEIRRVDRVGGIGEKKRVAVGLRFEHVFGGDIVAGAGTILDDTLLADAFRQPLRD